MTVFHRLPEDGQNFPGIFMQFLFIEKSEKFLSDCLSVYLSVTVCLSVCTVCKSVCTQTVLIDCTDRLYSLSVQSIHSVQSVQVISRGRFIL